MKRNLHSSWFSANGTLICFREVGDRGRRLHGLGKAQKKKEKRKKAEKEVRDSGSTESRLDTSSYYFLRHGVVAISRL